jgi:predicted nucleic acid-binding protein
LSTRTFAYFDTSAWVKLYINESGSGQVRLLARKHSIVSSAILLTESFSALRRKKDANEIDSSTFEKLKRLMREDSGQAQIVTVSDAVLEKSEHIVLNSAARSLDAIHLASAMVFENGIEAQVLFVTSDQKQFQAAQAQRLNTLLVG